MASAKPVVLPYLRVQCDWELDVVRRCVKQSKETASMPDPFVVPSLDEDKKQPAAPASAISAQPLNEPLPKRSSFWVSSYVHDRAESYGKVAFHFPGANLCAGL